MADPRPYVLRRETVPVSAKEVRDLVNPARHAYTVHDRATGEKIGRVIRSYYGWDAYSVGGDIIFDWTRLQDACEWLWAIYRTFLKQIEGVK